MIAVGVFAAVALRGEGILRMEDAGTSEEDDIDSQDSNTPIDHGHLARNCLIKIMYWCPVDLVLNKPPGKNQVCGRSGDLAGHVMYSNPLPIHCARNCSFKNVQTMLAKCGGASSCC